VQACVAFIEDQIVQRFVSQPDVVCGHDERAYVLYGYSWAGTNRFYYFVLCVMKGVYWLLHY